MKRFKVISVARGIFFIAFCLFILLYGAKPLFALPSISAPSAVAIDAETGRILYQKNAFQLRAPASTTKILTAIIAIESGHLEDVVTVSKNAASVGEASLHLKACDKLLLRELVFGALIKSGNDACVAIAEYLSPSEEEFVGLMNLKAQLLGAYDTTFYNTNGLPHPYHLTTAYDLALIARYALQNPLFSKIVATKNYTMKWTNPQKATFIKNTNRLLWSFPEVTGVKTGTTIQAGKCLVASAKYGQQQIVAVVLNSDDRYGDAQKLLEYGIKTKEIQSYAKR
ncbi:MAG: D-alanyl-D-alanine carboxypeptidase family protein [Peptococcia bacterium]